MISIALDAMGGDFAPAEIIRGAVAGGKEAGVHLLLIGPAKTLRSELLRYDLAGLSYELVEATDIIAMEESPTQAMRRKPNSSVAVATRLVKEGHADAALTMGHSGAALIAGRWILGMLPGVARPALPAPYLGIQPEVTLIDAGGNTDVRPVHMLQFAQMGAIYAGVVVGIANPRVGLLSNGREPGKGSELLKATYTLLQESALNFIGNIEGNDIPAGVADVVVHDGLVGNVALKLTEGVIRAVLEQTQSALLQALPEESEAIQAALDRVRATNHYSRWGAVPLLGIDGLLLVGHGRSRAKAVIGGIKSAKKAVASQILSQLRANWGA